ncbi:MAG: hypothetical protein EOP45_09605 [Sphingobacteriaceae bacterium]|nr:MAG: hypothetical protein EOP45_09605 [Sphingobacteriaceae bacterium]
MEYFHLRKIIQDEELKESLLIEVLQRVSEWSGLISPVELLLAPLASFQDEIQGLLQLGQSINKSCMETDLQVAPNIIVHMKVESNAWPKAKNPYEKFIRTCYSLSCPKTAAADFWLFTYSILKPNVVEKVEYVTNTLTRLLYAQNTNDQKNILLDEFEDADILRYVI